MVVFSLMLLATACSGTPDQEQGVETRDLNTSTQETSEKVLATVNGEEVTSQDVAPIQQTLAQQGQNISKKQALEQTINQVLLEQKVQEKNITVTDKEAEAAIKEQLEQQGMKLEQYKQQMKAQGMAFDTQLESMKSQIATQKYLDTALGDQEFNVTDEETKQFYKMYKQQSTEELQPYEEMKPQLKTMLKQRKQQQAINTLLKDLKNETDITYE